MKVLFIGFNSGSLPSGGIVGQQRNLQLFKMLVGEDNVDVILYKTEKRTVFSKVCHAFSRFIKNDTGNISKELFTNIVEKSDNYDIIHIDLSYLGKLIYAIKNHGYKGTISCYFHNIESCFNTKLIKKFGVFSKLYTRPLFVSEKLTCKYADKVFILNKRDESLLYKLYGRKADLLTPITLKDTYQPYLNVFTNEINLLFVGSFFFANTEALKWLDKFVVPNISNIKITVVGSNMSKMNGILKSTDVFEIHDFVEDLGYYYKKATAVILPLFEGGGMKIKTCEALMWGKYIIGTPEAFQGYHVNSKCSTTCQNSQDFIDSINKIQQEGIGTYCEESRAIFVKYYTNNYLFEQFKTVFL